VKQGFSKCLGVGNSIVHQVMWGVNAVRCIHRSRLSGLLGGAIDEALPMLTANVVCSCPHSTEAIYVTFSEF
jgi:hypothetical protein